MNGVSGISQRLYLRDRIEKGLQLWERNFSWISPRNIHNLIRLPYFSARQVVYVVKIDFATAKVVHVYKLMQKNSSDMVRSCAVIRTYENLGGIKNEVTTIFFWPFYILITNLVHLFVKSTHNARSTWLTYLGEVFLYRFVPKSFIWDDQWSSIPSACLV